MGDRRFAFAVLATAAAFYALAYLAPVSAGDAGMFLLLVALTGQRIRPYLLVLAASVQDAPGLSYLWSYVCFAGIAALLVGGYVLRRAGGLVVRGQGTIALTYAGRALAQPLESGATLEEYHQVLRNRVRRMKSASGKTIDILNTIIEAGGESLTTEAIGQAIGVDHTGGYFSNCIGPLGTVGLVTRRAGEVTPTEVLFPRGLS